MKHKHYYLILSSVLLIAVIIIIWKSLSPNISKERKQLIDKITSKAICEYGIPIDSLTITYIHKKVLQPHCALIPRNGRTFLPWLTIGRPRFFPANRASLNSRSALTALTGITVTLVSRNNAAFTMITKIIIVKC